jgi:pyruvate carboxylase subunit B
VVKVNGKDYAVKSLPGKDGGRAVEVNGTTYTVAVQESRTAEGAGPVSAPAPGGQAETVLAPMPGDIVKLTCEDGEQIGAGTTVLVMEAMKMQLEVKTRRAGTITYKVNAGNTVKAEQALAVIA